MNRVKVFNIFLVALCLLTLALIISSLPYLYKKSKTLQVTTINYEHPIEKELKELDGIINKVAVFNVSYRDSTYYKSPFKPYAKKVKQDTINIAQKQNIPVLQFKGFVDNRKMVLLEDIEGNTYIRKANDTLFGLTIVSISPLEVVLKSRTGSVLRLKALHQK